MNCLMIPIHPPKINWLYMFLKSIKINDLECSGGGGFEIVLLVSTDYEKIQLVRGLQNIAPEYLPYIKFVDIGLYITTVFQNNELLNRYLNNTFTCIVNVKKWCGLHWAMTKYQGVAVIDCDTFVRKETNLADIFDKMHKNYAKKVYLGASVEKEGLIEIIDKCISFFDESQKDLIAQMNGNLYVYTWFFDVPFYLGTDLMDFFDWALSDKCRVNFWLEQNWHSFEHIIFVYYRCIYKGAKIIDYAKQTGFEEPEVLTVRHLMYLKYMCDYMPVWAKFSTVIDDEMAIIENEDIYLMYHTDRI